MIFQEGPVRSPPQNTNRNNRKQYPLCLVMAPTRELASQIYDEARKVVILKLEIANKHIFLFSFSFLIDLWFVRVLFMVGLILAFKHVTWKKGAHVLLATPGRLNDLIQRGRIGLANVRYD